MFTDAHLSRLARKIFYASLFLLLTINSAFAQDGVSSAAASRSRYLAEAGMLPESRSVAVEEFVNYYRHRIATPKAGESVAVDLRWGSERMIRSARNTREAAFQVGFATPATNDRTDLRPLNLVIVVDRSGSMTAEDKMSRVKQSLLTMIKGLRPTDLLAIVTFESSAQVLLPSAPLGDGTAARNAIQSIEPDGSTNLHGGLMLGYKEAARNFKEGATNRVILLTDGIANVGVTNAQQIVTESKTYNERGIDLSTIGVGLDLDKDLLRDLARGGRGLFHFVADVQDVEKVFVKELQSLVSPVARRVRVEIDYDPELEPTHLYGYEPQYSTNRATLNLDDMNQGLTEVVLMNFRLKNESTRRANLPVRVRLSYYDVVRKREVMKEMTTEITTRATATGSEMLQDAEVRKNFTVAEMAQAVRDMATEWEAKRYREAERLVANALAAAKRRYPNMEDRDIFYTYDILQKYGEAIKKHNRNLRGTDG